MTEPLSDTMITIRELQRNAADVFDRARRGQHFTVTRHGETVGRILPPDPAEEAIEQAIANGILDPAILDQLPTGHDTAAIPREPSPPGTRLGSEAIIALRDEHTR
ncbi:type II toxin-antitoxin system Phd/YefM family antitoxin [Nocardia sp. NPDC058666]|uniref:type II toxin-antitoxin system Phd/YefM family antitoxin n=1 Tax=unclassified Nocardia TaxID=2637762 RepID=UPI003660788C